MKGALVITINDFYEFDELFVKSGRVNHFSPDARKALFEYLWQSAEDMGENIEADPIGLCGDFSEMTIAEAFREYGIDLPRFLDPAVSVDDLTEEEWEMRLDFEDDPSRVLNKVLEKANNGESLMFDIIEVLPENSLLVRN
jgi:hypothetical protein